MQVTVSLIVDVDASADINQIEQAVQEAGKPPMRVAMRDRWCERPKSKAKAARTVEVKSSVAKGRIDGWCSQNLDGSCLRLSRMRCQQCRRRFRPADACLLVCREAM
jgi:hypothetical protein